MSTQRFSEYRPANFRIVRGAAAGLSYTNIGRIPLVMAGTVAIFCAATASLSAAPQLQEAGTPTVPVREQSAHRAEQKRNEDVIRRANASLNARQLDRYLACFVEDAKNFNVPMGREGIRRGVEDILATFPDWHMEILELVAHQDSVIVRTMVSGTHLGTGKLPMNGGMLVGVPPTGKHFSVEHIHWFKLRDGKIVAHTATRNDIGMMRQLGLLPPTGLPK